MVDFSIIAANKADFSSSGSAQKITSLLPAKIKKLLTILLKRDLPGLRSAETIMGATRPATPSLFRATRKTKVSPFVLEALSMEAPILIRDITRLQRLDEE